jgi:hypothetical protein
MYLLSMVLLDVAQVSGFFIANSIDRGWSAEEIGVSEKITREPKFLGKLAAKLVISRSETAMAIRHPVRLSLFNIMPLYDPFPKQLAVGSQTSVSPQHNSSPEAIVPRIFPSL